MKTEAQRIAIAGLLGTHTVSREMQSWNPHQGMEPELIYVLTDKNGKVSRQWVETVDGSMTDNDFIYPKEYTSDLNACHEMEKALSEAEMDAYAQQVYTLVARDNPVRRYGIHATAAQRCEAFLSTLSFYRP